MDLNLKGKTVVVTGGSGGVGHPGAAHRHKRGS
jgi:NAD(P)-dependent dehydrogenase (short-subunit alcohol dehydrogenase family)